MKNKLYNVIFPIWFLIFLPITWLIVLPANFLIDSLVLLISLKLLKISNIKEIYKKSILFIWIFGFISDIIGAFSLMLTQFISTNNNWINNIFQSIVFNPFTNIYGFIYTSIAVIISGICIYLLNKKISLKKTNLEEKDKKKVAIVMAIVTAPYLFFVPADLMYDSGYSQADISIEKSIETEFAEFVDKYKGTYIGDNRITKIFSESSAFTNEIDFSNFIIDRAYEIHSEEYDLECNITFSKVFELENEEEYNKLVKALEKSSLITFCLSNNTESITINMSSQENKKSIHFEKQKLGEVYNIDFNTVLNDISTLAEILGLV